MLFNVRKCIFNLFFLSTRPGDPTEKNDLKLEFQALIIRVTLRKNLFSQYFLYEISLLNFFSQMDFNYSIILSTQILSFFENFDIQDVNVLLTQHFCILIFIISWFFHNK